MIVHLGIRIWMEGNTIFLRWVILRYQMYHTSCGPESGSPSLGIQTWSSGSNFLGAGGGWKYSP